MPTPRFGSSVNSYFHGSRYFYDGSFIRLKNIELAYTFTDGWIRHLGLSSLKLYVNGNNLWYTPRCRMTANRTLPERAGLRKALTRR